VIILQETGVVHQITYSIGYFFVLVALFIQFILDIENVVLYPVKQVNHILLK